MKPPRNGAVSLFMKEKKCFISLDFYTNPRIL